jgi:DNA-binding MarR family transcriptional regulator
MTEASTDDVTGQIADLMMHITRRIRINSTTELAPVGLTHAQSRALRIVARADGPIRMADIAARLDIVPRAATSVVDSLEEADLVSRHADHADRRSILVSLTPKGRQLRAQLAEARSRAADSVLSSLTHDDRQQLLRLLSTISGSCPRKGNM